MILPGTGRWGPTWYYNRGPCIGPSDAPGCEDDPTDQFEALARGDGEFAACAAAGIPVESYGSRCGTIDLARRWPTVRLPRAVAATGLGYEPEEGVEGCRNR